jgi:adrenodoxin-NADP+ reductase
MSDAFTTGDAIAEDWLSGKDFLKSASPSVSDGWDGVRQELGAGAGRVVTWDQWRLIDAAEKARGRANGKEREKFTNIADMLAVLD